MKTTLHSTMATITVAILATFALSSCENTRDGTFHASRSRGVGPKGNSVPMTSEHISVVSGNGNGMHSMNTGPTKGGPWMSNADMPRS